jgi:DNA-binding transcriptional LysR family regulator
MGAGMLERHELEAFITLAEELHFGRTAERLRVSTTRVSQIVRKLERRVGVPLFDRTSRRVQLTAVGRQLYEDIQPAWAQIGIGFRRAIGAGRGITGMLRVGFVGAAASQLVVQITEVFRDRYPDCDVQIREAQIGQVLPWIRDGVVDLALSASPADPSGIATGGVLISEFRMLAVPTQHPLAQQETISVEDLARIPLIQLPTTLPDATPGGRPIQAGPTAETFQEMLMLIGSGLGAAQVGAHARRYYARPDVTYVSFSDAPPIEWGLLWRADAATARVLAFNQTARDLLHR